MSELSLYELNKNIMENVPKEAIPTEEQLIEKINNYDNESNYSNYYMLLSHQIHYYTVFERIHQRSLTRLECLNDFAKEVILCLQDLGEIIGVSEEPGALEFWVQTKDGPECFYLFNYAQGIVYFKGENKI